MNLAQFAAKWRVAQSGIPARQIMLNLLFCAQSAMGEMKIPGLITRHLKKSPQKFLRRLYLNLLFAIQKLCKNAKVLDCFTHTGSFALNAGIAGAASVTGVDASQLAVDQATANATLNGLSDNVKFICEDVFELLPELEEKGEKFDVVILDPPAFTKSRNSIKNAVKGYREINLRAMKLVKDGGFLATCSCSHFMDYELFTKTIGQAAKNVHKRLRQVEYRTQAPDHPILWAADESYYLKFYIFQVCNDR